MSNGQAFIFFLVLFYIGYQISCVKYCLRRMEKKMKSKNAES